MANLGVCLRDDGKLNESVTILQEAVATQNLPAETRENSESLTVYYYT